LWFSSKAKAVFPSQKEKVSQNFAILFLFGLEKLLLL